MITYDARRAGKTVRLRIREALTRTPGMSATELAHRLGHRVDSVASLCARLVRRGELRRQNGLGPKGGYGYFVNDSTT